MFLEVLQRLSVSRILLGNTARDLKPSRIKELYTSEPRSPATRPRVVGDRWAGGGSLPAAPTFNKDIDRRYLRR